MSLLVALLLPLLVFGDAPEEGTTVPEFRLQDQNGEWHSPADYEGQWLVLYFYPKDQTPGCTTEACNFRDDIFKFKEKDSAVLGVSVDDVESHVAFAEKYELPFPLLADPTHEVATTFGVLRDWKLFKIANRETFLIAPDGTIAIHYDKVDPETHSAQILADLERMQSN
jgi:peroxiredoxin Q/BCP